MPRGKRLDESQIQRLKALSEMRCTQDEIADQLGITKDTVHRYQKRLMVPASNRFNGGLLAASICDTDMPCNKESDSNDETRENKVGVTVVETTIVLTGSRTGFMYSVAGEKGEIRVTSNGNADFVINAKDLVAFGNELLDVAEKIINFGL